MKVKNYLLLLLTTVVLLFAMTHSKKSTERKEHNDFTELEAGDKLVVAIDQNQSGYSVIDGKPIGYLYDILAAFCNEKELELTIVPKISSAYTKNRLESGRIDMAAVNSNFDELNISTLSPKFSSKYVVVTTKENNEPLCKESEVIITQSFTASREYSLFTDSTKHYEISFKSPERLMNELVDGDFDYLICNEFDAKLFIRNNPKAAIVHTNHENVELTLAVNVQNKALKDSFDRWFMTFATTKAHQEISDLYNDDIFRNNIISKYDALIRKQCEKEGFDWRFISAIAYNESRFQADIRSNRGATGLMQIMPRIARHYDKDQALMEEPEHNIEVALKLLRAIEASLKLPSSTLEQDKLSLILACYNGGVGHVADARRLAKKYGANPNRWEDVSTYLQAKNYEEYYTDEVVKYGRFKAVETTQFVSKVLGRYDIYRQMASL